MEYWTLSHILGYSGVIVAVLINSYALHQMWHGKMKLHAFSVFIWFFLSAMAFTNMLVQGLEETAYRAGMMTFLLLLAFLFTVRQGFGYITKTDWIFLGASVMTIPIWLATESADLALIWMMVIEIFGTIPNIRKGHVAPFDMNPTVYFFVALSQALVALGMVTGTETYSTAMLVYMVTFPVMWFGLTAHLLYRLKVVKQEKAA